MKGLNANYLYGQLNKSFEKVFKEYSPTVVEETIAKEIGEIIGIEIERTLCRVDPNKEILKDGETIPESMLISKSMIVNIRKHLKVFMEEQFYSEKFIFF